MHVQGCLSSIYNNTQKLQLKKQILMYDTF